MTYQLNIPWSRGKLVATVVIALLCVAVADFYSGSEIRFFLFYFVPIAISAINLGHRDALLTAMVSTALWLCSNYWTGIRYSSEWALAWNIVVQGTMFLFVAELMSALHVLSVRESELARVDPLTGLSNIRFFNEQAPHLIGLCQRASHPVVMAYIDLDNFKAANDRQGHQYGDELLRLAADVMKTELRSSDLLARIGGDEFVVILPNISAAAARETLERLREALAIKLNAAGSGVTASIGAISYVTPPSSLQEMLGAADEVMYAVKQSGKNRVMCREGNKKK